MDKADINVQWNTTRLYTNEVTLFAAAWMDLEIITLSEISHKEKDKYRTISLICEI